MSAPTAAIVKRPQGQLLKTSSNAATVSSSAGDAIFNSPTHSMVTGDYIYIYSLLGSYNGFWYVVQIDASNFKIREYPSDTNQPFINSGSAVYFKTSINHNYSCLHLPIVYKLSNTLWPNNTVDIARTVSSFSNDSNYVKLVLSGSLGTFNALAYIQISGANSATVNGSFQVLTKTNSFTVTINIPYNAAYDFTGARVILYYNNYHISLNIWAGLNASHPWYAVNPYKKILSISIVPDNTNIASVNINEYLKTSIDVMSNNLQLDTLPNNTDFFCQFYIEYSENYDQSDGTNVTTFTSDLVSDQSVFEGVAMNSKLQFKSRYSGFLSDYISDGVSITSKFLTSFPYGTIYPSQYFDLSFILTDTIYNPLMKRQCYKNGSLVGVFYDKISYTGIGLYRFPITRSGFSEEYVDCTIIQRSVGGFKASAFSIGFGIGGYDTTYSETKRIYFSSECFRQQYSISWLNNLGGFDHWQFTGFATHGIDISDVQTQTKNLFTSWPNSYGEFASTIKSETKRISINRLMVRSQNVNKDLIDYIAAIKESPSVQLVNSQYDTRTILLDTSSFDIRKDGDKTFNISFSITYTDENPSQQL